MDRHPLTIDNKPADIKAPESQGSNTFDILRTWVLNKYGAAVVGLTTVGAMATGCAAESQSPEPAPSITNIVDTEPDTNTDANPEATNDAEAIGNETVSGGELAATLTAEQLAIETANRFSTLIGKGTENPSLEDEHILAIAEGKVSNDTEFFGPIAEKNVKEMTDDLFIEGWEENPNLKYEADNYTKLNNSTMITWSKTTDTGVAGEVPYSHTISIDSEPTVISETPDTIVVSIDCTDHTNVDKNHADELYPDLAKFNGNKFTYTITYTLVSGSNGDVWKISDIVPNLR